MTATLHLGTVENSLSCRSRTISEFADVSQEDPDRRLVVIARSSSVSTLEATRATLSIIKMPDEECPKHG